MLDMQSCLDKVEESLLQWEHCTAVHCRFGAEVPQDRDLLAALVNAQPQAGLLCGWSEMLQCWADHGLVQRSTGRWQLTEAGFQALQHSHILGAPVPVCSVRLEVDAMSMTLYELISTLDGRGFQWRQFPRKKAAPACLPPFDPDLAHAAPKVWYTHGTRLCRFYLCALVRAQERRCVLGRPQGGRGLKGGRQSLYCRSGAGGSGFFCLCSPKEANVQGAKLDSSGACGQDSVDQHTA